MRRIGATPFMNGMARQEQQPLKGWGLGGPPDFQSLAAASMFAKPGQGAVSDGGEWWQEPRSADAGRLVALGRWGGTWH